MARKHASSPSHSKLYVVASAVFWDAEGIVPTDCLEYGITITGTFYADLIGNVWVTLKEKRRGKLYRGVLFHHDSAHVHTSSQKLAAIWKARFNYSVIHRIRQTWLWVTSVYFLNWKNSWKDANLLRTKMLSAWKLAGLSKRTISDDPEWQSRSVSCFELFQMQFFV